MRDAPGDAGSPVAPGVPDRFPTSVAGLPAARPVEIVDLADGDRFALRIAPVAKAVGDATVRMLAYNGSVPGPTLLVQEGTEIDVSLENQGDVEATVHWHGLRLDNRYDGTHETQRPVAVGETFTARVTFPDPGAYWYHPHVREDYGQELGLYGNVLVEPADPDYWPPAHRETMLTLDDILLEDGRVAPFSRSTTTHAAMGRLGDVLLVNGETDVTLRPRPGEVVRFYLTNAANTRVFDVALPGAVMKLVGGDSGRVEHEEIVDHVVLAPSERVVVDVLFGGPGPLALEHRTPERTYRLATIDVVGDPATPPLADRFAVLRTNPDLAAERERIAPFVEAEPDKVLALLAEMDMGVPGGAGNDAIDWAFRVGDQVKIRLLNEMAGDHPMHHPFHVHGAGRFLVLARDGVTEPNLVWKDTVLVRTGEIVDILLDVSDVGRWTAHCDIAEHHGSGMMFSFDVAPAAPATGGGE
jgi:FtsP/CotA-like multicopper oxidase with cupredoxin domain